MLLSLRERIKRLSPIFFAIVVFPFVISVLYYGVLASDIYISQSKFVVRSPEKSAPSALGVLLQGAGFSTASDEIYAAQQFLLSRDALRELNESNYFAEAYSRSEISLVDRFNPFGIDNTFEDLFEFYTKKVSVEFDSASSITSLSVRAYDPVVAKNVNLELLSMAEETVNRLNARGRQDLIRFALKEVEEAQEKSRASALALSAYRNKQGIIDPERQATIQLQMISKLQDELIVTKTQLREMGEFAPLSPQVPVLQTRARGLEAEIREQELMLTGGSASLARSAAEYERLTLENGFAQKQLASAMASLEDARNEARRKQAYVERVVQPSLPDKAVQPRRLRSILTVLILSLVVWGVLSMLLAGIREHQN